jgi:hypothetical protein
VSNVWQTRHRLMLERLEELADQLRSKEPIAPAVLEGQTVRLLAGAITLLRQHAVNKRDNANTAGGQDGHGGSGISGYSARCIAL